MELLTTEAAEKYLQGLLGEAAGYWRNYLINNRKSKRPSAYRIPHRTLGRRAVYGRDDLHQFAEWERHRRLGHVKLEGRAAEALRAFGIGEASGSATGRRLDCSVTGQVDAATNRPFVQMVIRDPLLVFRLDLPQAKALSIELTALVGQLEGIDRDSKT